jgi:hypothetical protein
MNKDLHDDELLLRYLDGELSEEDRKQLSVEIETDKELQSRIEDLKITIEAIKHAGTALKIKAMHADMMKQVKAEEKNDSPVRKMIRLTMAIAASAILVIVAIGIYTLQLSNSKIFDEHFLNYATSNSRGINENNSKLTGLFREGKYQQVVENGKAAITTPMDQLLIAVSYLQLKQPSAAIPLLITLQPNERFSNDADYYLGMAYLENNQPGLALQEFKKIREDGSHPYHKQVNNALIRKVRLLQWRD